MSSRARLVRLVEDGSRFPETDCVGSEVLDNQGWRVCRKWQTQVLEGGTTWTDAEVTIRSFDPQPGGRVSLTVRWSYTHETFPASAQDCCYKDAAGDPYWVQVDGIVGADGTFPAESLTTAGSVSMGCETTEVPAPAELCGGWVPS
jgi:hypothetical protein